MSVSSWDLDFRDGLAGENKIADLLSIDTVEVKTDRRWYQTNNIYVETECYYQNSQEWRPSGIKVSQATHWAFVLEDSVLLIPLYRLREAVYTVGKLITCNISPNPSKGYIITPAQLLEYVRQAREIEISEHNKHEEREKYN